MSIEAEYKGQIHSLGEWAKITGIAYNRLRKRYNKGDRGEALFRESNTVICKICGKEFTTSSVAKCCSEECKKENEKRNVASYYMRVGKNNKKTKTKAKKEKKLTVTEIAVKAKEAGMSYGQYVARMNM